MSRLPDVSVVIAARNAAEYLEETLESVQAQQHPPAEVIVVDDGSTDGTERIARRCGARVIHNSGQGAAAALNCGVEAARCEFIAHFDADDIMLENKLAAQISVFEHDHHARIGLVTSDLQMFDHRGQDRQTFLQRRPHFQVLADRLGTEQRVRLAPRESAEALCYEHCLDVKGIYRRGAWRRVGGFDTSYRCAYDMDFVWRLSHLYDVVVLRRVLLLGRRHTANLSYDPHLVEEECVRLFRVMLSHPSSRDVREVLRQRLRDELVDLAYACRQRRQYMRSTWRYVQALVA